MSLQEALRQMRLELGITQTDLAKMIHKSFLTVNRWENGKGFPSRENARGILDIAQNGNVSEECYDYLYDILKPDAKRSKSAKPYGFPDIDRDFFFQLVDDSINSLYVIEAETYKILYANKQTEGSAARYAYERDQTVCERRLLDQTDKRCFHYFGELDEPCPFCPIKEMAERECIDKTITIPEGGRVIHIHAKASRMKERKVYIIYLTDIAKSDIEMNVYLKNKVDNSNC